VRAELKSRTRAAMLGRCGLHTRWCYNQDGLEQRCAEFPISGSGLFILYLLAAGSDGGVRTRLTRQPLRYKLCLIAYLSGQDNSGYAKSRLHPGPSIFAPSCAEQRTRLPTLPSCAILLRKRIAVHANLGGLHRGVGSEPLVHDNCGRMTL
jgi:hypothetical protein